MCILSEFRDDFDVREVFVGFLDLPLATFRKDSYVCFMSLDMSGRMSFELLATMMKGLGSYCQKTILTFA